MGGLRPHHPGIANPPYPLLLGSKGRRPLVGIKRGNAPLASSVHRIAARNRPGCGTIRGRIDPDHR